MAGEQQVILGGIRELFEGRLPHLTRLGNAKRQLSTAGPAERLPGIDFKNKQQFPRLCHPPTAIKGGRRRRLLINSPTAGATTKAKPFKLCTKDGLLLINLAGKVGVECSPNSNEPQLSMTLANCSSLVSTTFQAGHQVGPGHQVNDQTVAQVQ